MESVRYLGLSGEGSGLRGGGVRGTAGLGAMEAAGIKPGAMCFYNTQREGREEVNITQTDITDTRWDCG